MGEPQRQCWQCQKPVGNTWVCHACGVIQPLPETLDYFACLGFPRHLQLDARQLAERFHERSRLVHPDFFQTKSERERVLSLEASALLNRAYRTLRHPVERMSYVIRLESGATEIPAKAPPDLLEEIFELQELIEGFRHYPAGQPESPEHAADREKLLAAQSRLQERLGRLDKELAELSVRWDRLIGDGAVDRQDGAIEPEKLALLTAMRDRLSSRQYLSNTIEEIALTLEGRADVKDRRH